MEDAVEEEPDKTRSVERLGGGDEMGVTSEAITHDPNDAVAVRAGKLDNVVHGDVRPRTERNVERLEESERLVLWGLDPAALVARLHIRAHTE